MKAIRLSAPGGLDRLKLTETEAPGMPRAGEILVRLHASSLNYHDYLVATGKIKTEDGRIPLSDGAGVIEAMGDGVSGFAVGDHVVSCFFPKWQDGGPVSSGFSTTPGDGIDGYAREQAVAPANWFTLAPKNYSHCEAATLTTAGLTAWRALVTDGGFKAGDSVLTLGSGGVSIFALQFTKAMGGTVIATSKSDEKLQRLKTLGADHVINYKQHENWGEVVRELTGGRGVDHVIEVGGPGTLPQSMTACCIGGHIALIGVLTGFAGTVPTAMLMGRHQKLQGLTVGSRQQQIEMVRAIEATEVKPIIDRTYPLDELAAAFQHEEKGLHFGKICIEI
ncbi:MAG TPA: NAD(P)-dependent alcohol dehydrogenase [Candidatus Acidoferrum sp.]|nr:NAD(P)-dependent alcohol dehydrogenase [Candidatus Acidoferrum sp.]